MLICFILVNTNAYYIIGGEPNTTNYKSIKKKTAKLYKR